MHQSQLRQLARQFADQTIKRAEYLRERSALIDGIVAGDIAITRVAPPPPPRPEQEGAKVGVGVGVGVGVTAEAEKPTNKLPLIIGAAVVIAAVIGWLLIPDDKPPAPVKPALVVQPAPMPQEPAARSLVEDFIAARAWSDLGISGFRDDWVALSVDDRDEARAAPWFRRLSKALRQEITTQKALAEIDQTGDAVAAGRRLVELGEFLGIADRLPTFDVPDSQSSSEPQQLPAAVVTEELTAETETAAAGNDEPSAAAWLASLDPEAVTLQLFAVNHLDKVERLVAAHPELTFRILYFSGEPRFRVVYGSFANNIAAQEGFLELPESIRWEQPKPLVQSVRKLLALHTGNQAPEVAVSESPDWLLEQDNQRFTIQLFASDNRASVKRLVDANPSLSLHAVDAGGTGSPYRVLYGSFASAAAAITASHSLPSRILKNTGKPLVKSFSELQSGATSSAQ